jgi:energy-converting hydrogenase Eha subunit E
MLFKDVNVLAEAVGGHTIAGQGVSVPIVHLSTNLPHLGSPLIHLTSRHTNLQVSTQTLEIRVEAAVLRTIYAVSILNEESVA